MVPGPRTGDCDPREPCVGRPTILMVKSKITCGLDSSLTSWRQVEAVLDKQGITLNTKGQKVFLEFVEDEEIGVEAVCCSKGDPKDGPFLMVMKVSIKNRSKYAELLTKLTGDKTLASLFDPSGPVYVRVLRCRPAFWELLKQACIKSRQTALPPHRRGA